MRAPRNRSPRFFAFFIIDKLKANDKDFVAEVRLSSIWGGFIPATVEPQENALHFDALIQSYKIVTGKEPLLFRKNSYTEAVAFSLHEIPALTFGPGDDAWSPTNEFVDLGRAMVTTKAYALAILRGILCEETSLSTRLRAIHKYEPFRTISKMLFF